MPEIPGNRFHICPVKYAQSCYLPYCVYSVRAKWNLDGVFITKYFNSLRSRRDRRHFADDIFKCVFLNENGWISLRISLKFVPTVRINNIPSLVQIMAWRRPGDKPLSEPMVISLPTHICVTRPHWIKLLHLQQWNSNQNTQFFIHEMPFKMSSVTWRPYCLRKMLTSGEIYLYQTGISAAWLRSHMPVMNYIFNRQP